jgi:hypothetical protein
VRIVCWPCDGSASEASRSQQRSPH